MSIWEVLAFVLLLTQVLDHLNHETSMFSKHKNG